MSTPHKCRYDSDGGGCAICGKPAWEPHGGESPHIEPVITPAELVTRIAEFAKLLQAAGNYIANSAGATCTPDNKLAVQWLIRNVFEDFSYEFTCSYRVNGEDRVFRHRMGEMDAKNPDSFKRMTDKLAEHLSECFVESLVVAVQERFKDYTATVGDGKIDPHASLYAADVLKTP